MILATFRKEPGHENMLNVNSISFVRCILDADSELLAINIRQKLLWSHDRFVKHELQS